MRSPKHSTASRPPPTRIRPADLDAHVTGSQEVAAGVLAAATALALE
jgi:hypothetical protein